MAIHDLLTLNDDDDDATPPDLTAIPADDDGEDFATDTSSDSDDSDSGEGGSNLPAVVAPAAVTTTEPATPTTAEATAAAIAEAAEWGVDVEPGKRFVIPGSKWDGTGKQLTLADPKGEHILGKLVRLGRYYETTGKEQLQLAQRGQRRAERALQLERGQIKVFREAFESFMDPALDMEAALLRVYALRVDWPKLQAQDLLEQAKLIRQQAEHPEPSEAPESDPTVLREWGRERVLEKLQEIHDSKRLGWMSSTVRDKLAQAMTGHDRLGTYIRRASPDPSAPFGFDWDLWAREFEYLATPYADAHASSVQRDKEFRALQKSAQRNAAATAGGKSPPAPVKTPTTAARPAKASRVEDSREAAKLRRDAALKAADDDD